MTGSTAAPVGREEGRIKMVGMDERKEEMNENNEKKKVDGWEG